MSFVKEERVSLSLAVPRKSARRVRISVALEYTKSSRREPGSFSLLGWTEIESDVLMLLVDRIQHR